MPAFIDPCFMSCLFPKALLAWGSYLLLKLSISNQILESQLASVLFFISTILSTGRKTQMKLSSLLILCITWYLCTIGFVSKRTGPYWHQGCVFPGSGNYSKLIRSFFCRICAQIDNWNHLYLSIFPVGYSVILSSSELFL